MGMEQKLAHLRMIQAVITRMAPNSFQTKGWSIILVAALFALAAAGTGVVADLVQADAKTNFTDTYLRAPMTRARRQAASSWAGIGGRPARGPDPLPSLWFRSPRPTLT